MKHDGAAHRIVRYWLPGVLFFAAVVTLSQGLVTASRPLNYAHAWVTADLALEARSFSNSGVAGLRGVPFSNNPPYGIRPEPYLHWPPLFPVLLSFVFRIFGESDASIHGFMLLIQAVTAVLIYLVIRACMSSVAGAFGVLAWLSQAVVLKYSHLAAPLNLAILFVVLAVLAFKTATGAARHRSLWVAAGAAAVFCGVLTSWEAVLATLGLLAGSLRIRDRVQRRIALILLFAGVTAAVSVLSWYAFMYPDLARDTLTTVSYRMGLSDLYSSSPIYHLDARGEYPYISLPQRALAIARFLVEGLGGPGLLAIAACICGHLESSPASREGALPADNRSMVVFAGLLVPPLAWFIAFSNHAANHEYEYLLAAPAAAFAIAWCADTALTFLAARQGQSAKIRTWAVAAIGPLLLLLPILSDASSNLTIRRSGTGSFPVLEPQAAVMKPDEYVQFGSIIRDATPQGSVVLTPEVTEVPIYYSHRHVIAGVADSDLARVLPLAKANFPDSPLYLAFYKDGRAEIIKVAR